MSVVLIALGGTVFLADLALAGLSYHEDQWLNVRRFLKLGITLTIVGVIIMSAGVLGNTLSPQSAVAVVLVIVGAAPFTLGICVEVASLAKARKNRPKKPETS